MEIKIICFSNPGSVCCLQKLFIFVAMLGKESARQDILTKRFCLSLFRKRPIFKYERINRYKRSCLQYINALNIEGRRVVAVYFYIGCLAVPLYR